MAFISVLLALAAFSAPTGTSAAALPSGNACMQTECVDVPDEMDLEQMSSTQLLQTRHKQLPNPSRASGSSNEESLSQEALILEKPPAKKPFGSNLGGWLLLEDWFFSGPSGRFVSTSNHSGQGTCLPPLLLGGHGENWPSEGVLVQRLVQRYGKKYAIEVFEGHRNSFIGDSDLKKMAELGLKVIRVPISWTAFAYALASIDPVYGSYNPQTESVVVPDLFYTENISFVTIPHQVLEDLFVRGQKYGLKFMLDIHAFPGGSSEGTYNGIFPNPPKFWNSQVQFGSKNISLQDAGLMIVEAAVHWMKSLKGPSKKALVAFTPMNEPAHLSGFVEPYNESWAQYPQVLAWLGNATQLFMDAGLPEQGVDLYMNVIGTAFPNDTFANDVPTWWNELTSEDDQNSWAVIDVHWYTAWDTKAGDIPGDSAVICSQPLKEILRILRPELHKYAKEFAEQYKGRKACSEFSAGTNSDALLACTDNVVARAWMEEQIKVMEAHDIMPYFWSFKMPYGPTFEGGWSLKRLFGLESYPSPHPCDQSFGPQLMPDTVPCFSANCG